MLDKAISSRSTCIQMGRDYSCKRMRHLSRTDVFNDVRFKFQHKKHIYRFHKQINNNRLARVVYRRKSAHSAHWLSLEIRKTKKKIL